MSDTTPVPPVQKPRKTCLFVLAGLLLVAAGVAVTYACKYNQAKEESMALQSQLADAEKQVSELQPLAHKARKLPVSTRLVKHAFNAGYNLSVFNQSRAPIRLSITVTVMGRATTHTPVIDGGRVWFLNGLAPSDTVTLASEGYDTETITIQ